MERIYLEKLINWNQNRRKPLMVSGARQIGKTYLVKELFAKRYYKDSYIYIDFKLDDDFRTFICGNKNNGGICDAKRIIEYIEARERVKITNKTLLIFDEIQEALPIITSLKYFKQDFPEIPVIVTGSMVKTKLNREITKSNKKNNEKFFFPVGCVQEIYMYPLNFEEFLLNYNKILYNKIIESYKNETPLSIEIHNLALDTLYKFLLVGGMPENVELFLKNESLVTIRENTISLFNNYLNDMKLYQASRESIIRAKIIFNNIYAELNKESKNFKASILDKGLKIRDFKTPIEWLETANVIYLSKQIKENVTIPFINDNESNFRLYILDTGFLAYQSDINMTTFIDNSKKNTLSGIFFENYIACEMTSKGIPLFYWRGKNNSEFEFMLNDNDVAIPVDVKKGKGVLNSLEKFKEHNRYLKAIKFSKNNYGYDEQNKIETIPLYMAFVFFNEYIKKKLIE